MRYQFCALRFVLVVAAILAPFATAVRAQITDVNNSTSTPTPGVGHNYLGTLNETVDPANGSVSLRIPVPVPPGRGIQAQFAFAYDSNGVHFPSPAWSSNKDYFLSQGGWTYAVPLIGWSGWQKQNKWNGSTYTCYFASNFMLQDIAGGRHSLGIGWNSNTNGCSTFSQTGSLDREYLSGGDDYFRASLSSPGIAGGLNGAASADGEFFQFTAGLCPGSSLFTANGHCIALPNYIEDRNGNKILFNLSSSSTIETGAIFNITDDLGRTLLSSSGFGTTGNTVTDCSAP